MATYRNPQRYEGVPSYNSTAWRRVRESHLRLEPLCRYCLPASVPGYAVDHIVPHRGDVDLFFDPENLQTLCLTHHNQKILADNRGASGAANLEGSFLDPLHPWSEVDRVSVRQKALAIVDLDGDHTQCPDTDD